VIGIDHFPYVLLIIGLGLGFIYGVIAARYEKPPWGIIQNSHSYVINTIKKDSREIHLSSDDLNKNSDYNIHFLNVGHAHCVCIEIDNGQTILIDAGRRQHVGYIQNYLQNMNINKIDYLILTGYQTDHVGGVQEIVDSFGVETVYLPPKETDEHGNRDRIYSKIECELERLTSDLRLSSEAVLEAYNYDCTISKQRPKNNCSLVLRFVGPNSSVLLMSDAMRHVEETLLESNMDLSSDVIHVGHHGKAGGSHIRFIRDVDPDVAILTTKNQREYSLQVEDTIDKFESISDSITYWNVKSGSIVLQICGGSAHIVTQS